jgi:hypothetical protein
VCTDMGKAKVVVDVQTTRSYFRGLCAIQRFIFGSEKGCDVLMPKIMPMPLWSLDLSILGLG